MTPRQALLTRLINKGIDWGFIAILGGVAALFVEPVRDYAKAVVSFPHVLEKLEKGVESNAREIQKLRIPRDIFSLSSRSSGPVDDFCTEGQNCQINVRVRRNPDAIDCQLVPDAVIWFYRNPRDNETHNVIQISGEPKNVGEGYENFLFTLTTPANLRPEAELCLRPAYVGCPGQYDADPAISPDTECMDIEIR